MSYSYERVPLAVEEYWVTHYIAPSGLCMLCGNTGVIRTQPRCPKGLLQPAAETYCVCPNGHAMRADKQPIEKEAIDYQPGSLKHFRSVFERWQVAVDTESFLMQREVDSLKVATLLTDIQTEMVELTRWMVSNHPLWTQRASEPGDYAVDLCLRMMLHAAYDDRHGDMKCSEVREKLEAFFPKETLQRAAEVWKARSGETSWETRCLETGLPVLPPAPDQGQ